MNTQTWMDGKEAVSFMLVGVGGQGTILASDVIAEVGLNLGFDVKKAEVHGMSQRGGSVNSQVRWGKKVYSPIIGKSEADILVAFEKSEVSRYMDSLKFGGLVLVNNYSIVPITVSSGGASYPADESIKQAVSLFTPNLSWIEGIQIADGLGNPKVANVVILGSLSALMGMEAPVWLEAIKKRVPPKTIALNQAAFEAGRKVVEEIQ
jgi:indolepyruvate ferredoxin oxidoreductase, beta subunit